MDAELGSQLGGSTTSAVSHHQSINVLGGEAHLDLPWGDGLGSLPGTPAALRHAQEAVARV